MDRAVGVLKMMEPPQNLDLNPIMQTLEDFGQMVWTDFASDVQKT